MKHYKKDGKIIVELSPLELMRKYPKVWSKVAPSVRRQLLYSPKTIIRVIDNDGSLEVQVE